MRIWIIGAPGSGKSTLAQALAKSMDLPVVELDSLYWLPEWEARDPVDFARVVYAATSGKDWVVDGNYKIAATSLIRQAELLIWLDLPLTRTYPRVVRRTMFRLLWGEKLWNGNRERFTNLLSRDGMLWYSLAAHRKNHARFRTFWDAFAGAKVRLTDPHSAHADALRTCHELFQPS